MAVGDRFFWSDCGPGVAEAVQGAVAELGAKGASISELPMPELRAANEYAVVGGLTVPEVFECIKSLFPDRVPDMDPDVWARLSTYGEISAQEYLGRRRKIRELAASANSRLKEIDVLLTPTTPITAPALSEVASAEGYRRHNVLMARNAYPMNLFDLCTITLPAGHDTRGLPVGLQISAPRGCDRELLLIAGSIERAIGAPWQRLGASPMLDG
jgi:aspartyl-tRNA(Asn)/glutamyl-tRNA(Gln) amidotransferase subunit A